MENENNIQDNEILSPSAGLQPSEDDISVTETQVTEETSTEPITDTSTDEIPVDTSTDTTEQPTQTEVVIPEPIDYTEALLEVNTTLHHIDSVSEYGVCILIVILIIVLLQYVYKFFKMFF